MTKSISSVFFSLLTREQSISDGVAMIFAPTIQGLEGLLGISESLRGCWWGLRSSWESLWGSWEGLIDSFSFFFSLFLSPSFSCPFFFSFHLLRQAPPRCILPFRPVALAALWFCLRLQSYTVGTSHNVSIFWSPSTSLRLYLLTFPWISLSAFPPLSLSPSPPIISFAFPPIISFAFPRINLSAFPPIDPFLSLFTFCYFLLSSQPFLINRSEIPRASLSMRLQSHRARDRGKHPEVFPGAYR